MIDSEIQFTNNQLIEFYLAKHFLFRMVDIDPVNILYAVSEAIEDEAHETVVQVSEQKYCISKEDILILLACDKGY
jgi:hypothetical protein